MAKQFMAQGDFGASFPYLQQAHVGNMLINAGHFSGGDDWGCSLFNWIMAYEVEDSDFQPAKSHRPEWYDCEFYGRWTAQFVIDAYTRLLAFQPDRAHWRSSWRALTLCSSTGRCPKSIRAFAALNQPSS